MLQYKFGFLHDGVEHIVVLKTVELFFVRNRSFL